VSKSRSWLGVFRMKKRGRSRAVRLMGEQGGVGREFASGNVILRGWMLRFGRLFGKIACQNIVLCDWMLRFGRLLENVTCGNVILTSRMLRL